MDNEQEFQEYNTQTNPQNELQQQLSEQSSNYKNNIINTKQIIIIVFSILGSVFLFFAIILPICKNVKSMFIGPSLSEYESYLTEKYKNDTFYYVSGDPSCVWFDSGYCQVVFSSTSLKNATFRVSAYHYDNSFRDNYYETKYGFNLEDYYYEKYGIKLLEDVISQSMPYNTRTTIINRAESSVLNGPFNSFDDFLTQLEEKGNDNMEIYLTIAPYPNNLDIYNLDWMDFASIESEIAKVIKQNNLKLASVNLIIANDKKEYKGTCPKEFNHTIRGDMYSSYRNRIGTEDNPDGRQISGCLRTIYSKT